MLMALAGAVFMSCSDEFASEGTGSTEGGIRITIQSKSLATRGTAAGLDKYNENRIKTLYLIFNHIDETEESEGIIRSYPDLEDPSSPGKVTVGVKFSREERMKLFPNGEQTCKVYAMVNCRETTTAGIKSVAAAKNTAIVKDLAPVVNDVPQPLNSFVMDGSGIVNLYEYNTDYDGQGSVSVKRLASKFNINVTVGEKLPLLDADSKEQYDEKGNLILDDNKWQDIDTYKVYDENGVVIEEWTPLRNQIIAVMSNGVGSSKLAYTPQTISPEDLPKKTEDYQHAPVLLTDDNVYFLTSPSFHNETSLKLSADKYKGMQVSKHDLPIYTYMNRWMWDGTTEGSDENVEKLEDMTYFVIQLPWQKKGATTYRYCYYQIPASRDVFIDRNYAYTINLNIGMLGSFDPANPFTIEDLSYTILDWNQAPDIEANITGVRYLVVNDPHVSVYNDEDIIIPFYSTHPTEVESLTVTYPVFTFDGNNVTYLQFDLTNESVIDATGQEIPKGDESFFKYKIEPVLNRPNEYNLVIRHSLKYWHPWNASGEIKSGQGTESNPLTGITKFVLDAAGDDEDAAGDDKYENKLDAFSKFDIKVTLKQTGEGGLRNEEIAIQQYPAMYIDVEMNDNSGMFNTSRSVYQAGNSTLTTLSNVYKKGLVFVNSGFYHRTTTTSGNTTTNTDTYYYQCKGGETGNQTLWTGDKFGTSMKTNTLGTGGTNNNPNIYTISLSKVDTINSLMKDFIITDPRTSEKSTPELVASNNEYWAYAPALNSDGNRILNNYYATSDDNENKIAPKIKIASSYGKSSGMDLTKAKKRCAAYQENGYPAGRWRVPTAAEAKYIIYLSSLNIIPSLFSTDYRYVTATGGIKETAKSSEYPFGFDYVPNFNDTYHYVRCVYDEWYWGNDKISDPEIFTWGDEEIKAKSNAKRK